MQATRCNFRRAVETIRRGHRTRATYLPRRPMNCLAGREGPLKACGHCGLAKSTALHLRLPSFFLTHPISPQPSWRCASTASSPSTISRDSFRSACQIQITVQRPLTCHVCGSPLSLIRTGIPNCCWQCPKNCLPAIDTGVPTAELLDVLRPDESGTVEFNASHFFPPITQAASRPRKSSCLKSCITSLSVIGAFVTIPCIPMFWFPT